MIPSGNSCAILWGHPGIKPGRLSPGVNLDPRYETSDKARLIAQAREILRISQGKDLKVILSPSRSHQEFTDKILRQREDRLKARNSRRRYFLHSSFSETSRLESQLAKGLIPENLRGVPKRTAFQIQEIIKETRTTLHSCRHTGRLHRLRVVDLAVRWYHAQMYKGLESKLYGDLMKDFVRAKEELHLFCPSAHRMFSRYMSTGQL
jgi:hypothetical protein